MLRQVKELPKRKTPNNLPQRESPVYRDVREFVRSGMEYATCEVRSTRTSEMRKGCSIALAARKYIERAGIEGVTARSINGTCYLIREEAGR